MLVLGKCPTGKLWTVKSSADNQFYRVECQRSHDLHKLNNDDKAKFESMLRKMKPRGQVNLDTTLMAKLGYNKSETEAIANSITADRTGREAKRKNAQDAPHAPPPPPPVHAIDVTDIQRNLFKKPSEMCTGPADLIWLEFFNAKLASQPALAGRSAADAWTELKDQPIMQ